MINSNISLNHLLELKPSGILNNALNPEDKLNTNLTPLNSVEKGVSYNGSQQGNLRAENVIRHQVSHHLKMNSSGQLDMFSEKTTEEVSEPNTASHFSPDTIASNIMNFVKMRAQQAYSDGRSESYIEGMISDAQRGVDQGFKEAKQDLSALGMLSDELNEKVDIAYDLTQSGLESIGKEQTYKSDDRNSSTLSTIHSIEQEHRFQGFLTFDSSSQFQEIMNQNVESSVIQSETQFSFELQTKEGDVVTVNLNSSFLREEQFSQYSDQAANYDIREMFSDQQSIFSFQIEGDLNESEMKAIDNILIKVNDLASQFFSGNLEGALAKASDLGIESNEIANFELNLKESLLMTRQQSVSSQNYYSSMNNDFNQSSGIPELIQYANQLIDTYKNVDAEFEKPQSLLEGLLQSVAMIKNQQNDQEKDSSDLSSLSSLTRQIQTQDSKFMVFNKTLMNAFQEN